MKITLASLRFLGVLMAFFIFWIVAWSASIMLPYLQIPNQDLIDTVWNQVWWIYLPLSLTALLLLLPFRRLNRSWTWAFAALVLCTVYSFVRAVPFADLVFPGILAIQLGVIYLQRFHSSPAPGPGTASQLGLIGESIL